MRSASHNRNPRFARARMRTADKKSIPRRDRRARALLAAAPEVPRQVIVPAAVVTKDNVADHEQFAFN